MLRYFNPNLETEVICDGSPLGLGAILKQIDENGSRNNCKTAVLGDELEYLLIEIHKNDDFLKVSGSKNAC